MKKSFILILLALSACVSPNNTIYSDAERERVDSIVRANRGTEALLAVLDGFAAEQNVLGEVYAYRELGRCYRNEGLFDEAVQAHKLGLEKAQQICDTMQIVQALNNIGTAYRRMGVLDEAASWHYDALTYCEQYSDTSSYSAIKNRVVSLNGIGNVQLTLGNPEMAEDAFRRALAGESRLGSPVGQAINYANIGALLEGRGQIDSARYYYAKSLEFNQQANSDLGISLCHTHFGRLYENEGNLDSAVEEYKKAYDVMLGNSDKWHWLDACVSLSRVYAAKGNVHLADKYLAQAKEESHNINSIGHLADVYRLEYSILKRKGNHKGALDAFVKSKEYSDSLANEKNLTHMQNVRVRFEQEKKQSEISMLQQGYEQDRHRKNMFLVVVIVILLLAAVAIVFLVQMLRFRSKNQRIMQELDHTKTNFFTNITHEFRTPLTVIQSAAYDIHTRAKSDKVLARDSADILRHGNSLLDLVNQILEIAKISSGKSVAPVWKRGDIVGFITMICERYVRYAEDRNIDIQYAFEKDKIEMDFVPDYMIRIVQNLIANAIKFSADGSQILISVKSTTVKGTPSIKLYVCDQGIGMNAQQKQDIFKPFYQASEDSKNIGSGIGLSLVKMAVEAMKGSIEVHSYPSEGTIFIVTLPIALTEKYEVVDASKYEGIPAGIIYMEEAQPEDEVSENSDSPRILIVEDTPEVARWQMRQLNPEYNFYFAADGEEGLSKAEDIVPDLIITDIMMPKMDGIQMCRKIRESELLCHIPVIMVTAKATQEDKVEGLQAGADAYLEKPFNADELSVRVDKLLQQREMLRKKFLESVQTDEPVAENEMSVSDRNFVTKVSTEVHRLIVAGGVDYNELASALCLSRTQLNRKIKAITGYTTTEYIQQIRISMAKQLLVKTDYPIGEIASKCGIDDVAYFSSLFRKAVGKTPTAYRNR